MSARRSLVSNQLITPHLALRTCLVAGDLDEFIIATKKSVSTTTKSPPIQDESTTPDTLDKLDSQLMTSTADPGVTDVTGVPAVTSQKPKPDDDSFTKEVSVEGSGEVLGSGDDDDASFTVQQFTTDSSVTTRLSDEIATDPPTFDQSNATTTEDFSGDEMFTLVTSALPSAGSTLARMTSTDASEVVTIELSTVAPDESTARDDGSGELIDFTRFSTQEAATDFTAGASTSDYVMTSVSGFTADDEGSGDEETFTEELATTTVSGVDATTVEVHTEQTSEEITTVVTSPADDSMTSQMSVSDVTTVAARTTEQETTAEEEGSGEVTEEVFFTTPPHDTSLPPTDSTMLTSDEQMDVTTEEMVETTTEEAEVTTPHATTEDPFTTNVDDQTTSHYSTSADPDTPTADAMTTVSDATTLAPETTSEELTSSTATDAPTSTVAVTTTEPEVTSLEMTSTVEATSAIATTSEDRVTSEAATSTTDPLDETTTTTTTTSSTTTQAPVTSSDAIVMTSTAPVQPNETFFAEFRITDGLNFTDGLLDDTADDYTRAANALDSLVSC